MGYNILRRSLGQTAETLPRRARPDVGTTFVRLGWHQSAPCSTRGGLPVSGKTLPSRLERITLEDLLAALIRTNQHTQYLFLRVAVLLT